ncbi:ribbon-helix-helix domain-containing protein [Nocardia sp. NPDC059177]|uniref:ribbon-helix-helix domain-containing protein n=1 Tax=Nocardia sp. NPDC059177 TaxID=3346759 RepID=UPI0036C1E03D
MATRKITVTVPEDLLDEIRAEASDRGLSAYIAEALRAKLERDRLLELAQWLQDEHGPVTDAERAAALAELAAVDAEHARLRTTQRHSA